MSVIRCDENIRMTASRLNSASSAIGGARTRVSRVHTILWADEAFTNAFSSSLIADVSAASARLKKQQERMEQYGSAIKTIEQELSAADRSSAKNTIRQIAGWARLVRGGAFTGGIAVVARELLRRRFHTSSSRIDSEEGATDSVGKRTADVGKSAADQTAGAAQKVIDETPRYTPFTEESVHDYSDGVSRGSIRYVNQVAEYNASNGWREEHRGGMSNGQCNWACESMAFSYLGVDQPPSTMHDTATLRNFELALGANDGYSATFDAVDGSANITVHSNGWGTSFDRGYLDTLVDNFAQDGGRGAQSPVMLHYSDGTNMHWILLTGKNADGTYRAIGPWSNPGGTNERAGFDVTISDSGVVSGSGFSGCNGGRRVDCIGQYTRTN